MKDLPIYMFTGFLESGKSKLIKETLLDPEFNEEDEKTLIICFEEGIEEYDEAFLKKTNSVAIYPTKELLTFENLLNLETLYNPDRLFIEFNGMWNVDEFLQTRFPDNWVLAQFLTTVNASTFQLFVNNMRSMIFQQVQYSQVVIFNRCSDDIQLSYLRSNIKAVNPRCQIVYENMDGYLIDLKEEDMPFDLNADIVEIKDEDYGLWYMDALEHPRKYKDKVLKIKAQYADDVPNAKHSFLLARDAMVCCADDTSKLGIVVSGVKLEELKKGMWLTVTGQAHLQEDETGQEVIVLVAKALNPELPLLDPLVYFS